MTQKSEILVASVASYITETITKDSSLEAKLRAETMRLENGGMISPPDVGALLALFIRIMGAKRAIEFGTFTGYTALKMASALPKGGKLVCCDISEEWANIGRKYWKEAGVEDKIDLRIAPALDTVADLKKGTFDFAFIDANKNSYEDYYEASLELLRPGGLIALDNMLWDGAVANPKITDGITKTLRGLNKKISGDARVHSCLLSVGDGLMLAQKI